MTQHSLWLNSPTEPKLCECIFDSEDGGLRYNRLRNAGTFVFGGIARRIKQGAQILTHMWQKYFAAAVDPMTEDRLGDVHLAGHIGMLRALPRKKKINPGGIVLA